jgi:uncharacterized protein (UPF0548 family)
VQRELAAHRSWRDGRCSGNWLPWGPAWVAVTSRHSSPEGSPVAGSGLDLSRPVRQTPAHALGGQAPIGTVGTVTAGPLTTADADRLRRRPPVRGVPRLTSSTLQRSAVVGSGTADFEHAADVLLSWGVQEGAGLVLTATDPTVRLGGVVRQEFRFGPLTLVAPCEVTDVWRDRAGAGFRYRTLHGHPELGAETFELTVDGGGDVTFRITAVSRPGTWLTLVGLPVMRLVQNRIIGRYLRTFGR